MTAVSSKQNQPPKAKPKKLVGAVRHQVTTTTIMSWVRKSDRLEREVRELRSQIQSVAGVRKPETDSLAAARHLGAKPGAELSAAAAQPVLMKIAASAEDVLGDGSKALAWLHSAHLPQFAGLTPAELVQQGLTHAVV